MILCSEKSKVNCMSGLNMFSLATNSHRDCSSPSHTRKMSSMDLIHIASIVLSAVYSA